MKLNNILKVSLAAVAVMAFSLSANAQFGNLGNRIKQKAKAAVENKIERTVDNAVDNALNKAENEAKKQLNLAVEYKTQLNAPQVNEKSDIDDMYDAFEYWANLQEMANKKKDTEWLCSEKGEKMTEVYNLILNDDAKEVARFHSLSTAQERFKEVATATRAFLYEGYPESSVTGEGNPYLVAALKWYVNKAKKGKKNAKNYYTSNGAATRYLAFCTNRYTDDAEIQKQTKELCKLYDQMDEDYKAKYPNANPYLTYDGIKEKQAAERKAAEERKAAAAAKKAAEIEASKQTLKAGALNKSLNAQVLKLAKQRVPKCTKVVVINDSWNVQREYGTPVRRTVLAWVVYKDDDGNLVANDYGFAQEYMGGGKYGTLKNYSVGVRKVYVK